MNVHIFLCHYQQMEQKKRKRSKNETTEEEDNGLNVYYSFIHKHGWKPPHSDIERDVKRWNSEDMFLHPIPDHTVCVIMPPETTTEEALRDFSTTNEFDIQERIIHVTNMYSCFLPDFLLFSV